MLDEQSFFIEGTLNICRHLNIEDALFDCLKLVRSQMPADGMYLQYYEPELGALRVAAKATLDGGEPVDGLVVLDQELREAVEAFAAYFTETGTSEAIIFNRPETDPICRAMLDFHGAAEDDSSLLILTLGVKGAMFGSITLHAYGHDRFTEAHARCFSLLNAPFTIAVSNARKHREVIRLTDLLADDNRYLQDEIRRISGDTIIGQDFGLKPTMDLVHQVARHDSPVLILGETGVGKDMIANAIHNASARASGPFIGVNCGAIPGTLLDSELFGHEKGAFTGALAQKRGRFERADKGSIFLDEIGELTPEAQIRLLRVLQNREIERVGGSQLIPVNIRIIAATNRNLEAMVGNGQFREDLWFRLNVFPIRIPPLRERRSDIPALVDFFLRQKAQSLKLRKLPDLAPGAMEQLLDYRWPGNVRELENLIERALILHPDGPIQFDVAEESDAPSQVLGSGSGESRMPDFHRYSSEYFRRVLAICDGKINGPGGAAQLTGLNPSTLRNKLRKLQIPFGTCRCN